jgi:IS5 family transposase
MIEMRRRQLSFGDGLICEEVTDLRENWMQHADVVLADEEVFGETTSQEPLPRAAGSVGRRGAATVDPQAHS